MKIKTAVISITVTAALAGGSIYGAYQYTQTHRDPVRVVSVEENNLASWFYGDEDEGSSLEATIFSRDTQTVNLAGDQVLSKVYVEQGDTVKIGDPLMEYDMTLTELQLEMEQILNERLQMTLEKQETQLEKIKANPNAASVLTSDGDDDVNTMSADTKTFSADLIEPEDADQTVTLNDDALAEENAPSDDGGLITDPVPETPQDLVDVVDPGETTDSIETPDQSGVDGILEEEDSGSLPDSDLPDGLLIDEGLEADNSYVIDGDVIYATTEDEQILFDMTEFRSIENRLRQQAKEDITQLNTDEIARALRIFRESLSATPAEQNNTIITLQRDVFGNTRKVELYLISDAVEQVLWEAFQDEEKVNNHKERLYRAYMNLLYFDLADQMYALRSTLDGAGVTASTITSLQAEQIQEPIAEAVSAVYAFQEEWSAVKNLLQQNFGYTQEDVDLLYSTYYRDAMIDWVGVDEDLSSSVDGVLSKLADKLNYNDTIEPEEPETEPVTEDDFDDGGFDFDDFGYDTGLSQEEIREMIRDQEAAIAETKLQIREKAIKIRQYERKLDGKIVRATINGIVKAAGSVDGDGYDDAFIVVSGAKGMYVRANINELKRDQIQVGDTITGTSYETNGVFTGVITEISEYPADDDDGYSWYWYYGSDSDNTNASFYPIVAYIEDADDLAEGSATIQINSGTTNPTGAGKLYLENYFVRTDMTGQAYVYIRGEDNLLKKQYVLTGGSLWGMGIEIKSGITDSDYIAFPYGKHVTEGAETVEAESLEDD